MDADFDDDNFDDIMRENALIRENDQLKLKLVSAEKKLMEIKASLKRLSSNILQ